MRYSIYILVASLSFPMIGLAASSWNENDDSTYFISLESRYPKEYSVLVNNLTVKSASATSFRRIVAPKINSCYECIFLQKISFEAPYKGYLLYKSSPTSNWLYMSSIDPQPVQLTSESGNSISTVIDKASRQTENIDFSKFRHLDGFAFYVTIKTRYEFLRFAAYQAQDIGFWDSSALAFVRSISNLVKDVSPEKVKESDSTSADETPKK